MEVSSPKRQKLDFFNSSSPVFPNISSSPKYKPTSHLQNERYGSKINQLLAYNLENVSKNFFCLRFIRLCTMLARCMLPISMVENPAFKEYINFIDPSFTIPTRSRIKDSGLPKLKSIIQDKIKVILSNTPNVNTSVDLWSDETMRPFNGYIAQGIDNNWELHTIPIEFEPITGKIFYICV